MKMIWFQTVLGAMVGAAVLPAHAHHTPEHSAAMGTPVEPVGAHHLSITGCWVRALPAQVPSAAYFTVANSSDRAATLTDVTTDAYGGVMMHATTQTGGMSRMTMAHDVAVPARGRVAFEPGGLHVMLSKPARAIEVGKTVDFTFVFAGNVTVRAPCTIREASALTN